MCGRAVRYSAIDVARAVRSTLRRHDHGPVDALLLGQFAGLGPRSRVPRFVAAGADVFPFGNHADRP